MYLCTARQERVNTMATISTRVDDGVKAEAESVANAIGMPLSTAINIFLKRFTAEKGFPFDVTVPDHSAKTGKGQFDRNDLEKRMQAAVAEADIRSSITPSDHFTYIDPETKEPITRYRKE